MVQASRSNILKKVPVGVLPTGAPFKHQGLRYFVAEGAAPSGFVPVRQDHMLYGMLPKEIRVGKANPVKGVKMGNRNFMAIALLGVVLALVLLRKEPTLPDSGELRWPGGTVLDGYTVTFAAMQEGRWVYWLQFPDGSTDGPFTESEVISIISA